MTEGMDIEISVLYEKYRDSLYGYLLKLSRNPDLAEDLIQETFLRVQKSIHTYDPSKGGFFVWAKTIARNIYIRQMSTGSERFTSESDNLEIVADGREGVSDSIEKNVTSDIIKSSIKCLPEPERSIVDYKYRLNMTLDEIAEKLSISRRTVSRRYLKAVELLKTEFSRRGLESES